MKTQIHIRASEATRAKLEALAERYGTKTEAVAVAIDRLHESEMKGEENMIEHIEGNQYRYDISGNRYQVTAEAWANWVGDTTPEEFMQGYDSIKATVDAWMLEIPKIWAEDPPIYFWKEANAEYTLAELLTRYLEDHINE